ncbi:transposase [Candidatus Chloroploca sp. M-50]|uniref:Transposase n=1 Tax=Candidatus Chloroploca mongolica TaxID=2528176 RepID=A0ABS4DB89_9CHLR|nr:transposase [Candidatus Chloroploca mongolica]
MTAHQDAIERQERVLLFVDECFLHWGDVCGYAWAKRNERATLDVVNTQARQPFYGALDALTGEMHLMSYPVAQTDNTTDFLVELRLRYPDAKLTICWDNARWHKGKEMERFLAEVNGALSPEDWPITCINVAPHDPTQNPIEEVWRQGKAAIQKLRLVATKFQDVIDAFEQVLERHTFDFPNRQRYGRLQMI